VVELQLQSTQPGEKTKKKRMCENKGEKTQSTLAVCTIILTQAPRWRKRKTTILEENGWHNMVTCTNNDVKARIYNEKTVTTLQLQHTEEGGKKEKKDGATKQHARTTPKQHIEAYDESDCGRR
jgi:hypothetical protein